MRRPPNIPQRRRVFLGCEAESEANYGALLALLVKERKKPIYIDNQPLQPGAGDPLELVKKAIQIMQRRAKERGKYVATFLLLDTDKCGESLQRDADALKHATKAGLVLIWQEPCHEAFLLRHLEGCESRMPASSNQAMSDLQRFWPEYIKGMPAVRLKHASRRKGCGVPRRKTKRCKRF